MADADTKTALKERRGGRPTRAAAAERDERLLEIATQMFLEQGFDATSIDAL
ncbi:MAG: TetR family transcriptional regulator, partial [Caulobacteraceae bacterium]|nr:TetR family transcriptional regulator [Caulobacter sp.]